MKASVILSNTNIPITDKRAKRDRATKRRARKRNINIDSQMTYLHIDLVADVRVTTEHSSNSRSISFMIRHCSVFNMAHNCFHERFMTIHPTDV